MIEDIEKNINTEIEMLREISNYLRRYRDVNEQERKLLNTAIGALRESMILINRSIPEMLKNVTLAKQLPGLSKSKSKINGRLENISSQMSGTNVNVVLDIKDKERFFKELSISEKYIKKLKKEEEDREVFNEYKGSRGYLKLANKLFLNSTNDLIRKGYFKSLYVSLRRANIDVLFASYIAMIFLTTFISIFVGIFLTIFLLFFEVNSIWPFISSYEGEFLARLLRVIWVPLIVPILTFLVLYIYPISEKKSLGKRVDQELAFAVIHMSAISGSGIEPSEIFKIIAMNREYPYLRKEIRKALNQINLYGYDLVTALNNASKTSPSDKLSELFAGLSTTITSGANLSNFFEKRSESLLLEYRLEREKYTRLVETFLDIYISVVIAAPMIFLLLLIMMAVSGIGIGIKPYQLSLIAVFSIALLNVAFIIFLQIKQPSY